jgi:hypothetical protein
MGGRKKEKGVMTKAKKTVADVGWVRAGVIR